jgi:hypothetical protein
MPFYKAFVNQGRCAEVEVWADSELEAQDIVYDTLDLGVPDFPVLLKMRPRVALSWLNHNTDYWFIDEERLSWE